MFLKDVLLKWKLLFSDKAYVFSLIIGFGLLIASYVLTYYVSMGHDQGVYLSVGDLILDKIPTFDLEFLFTWGIYVIVTSLFVFTAFFRPDLAPFVLKTYALLFVVRAGFVMLTNFGPPEGFFYADGVDVGINPLRKLIFKNDLFFSGHTAIPFMGFLLFKESRFKWFLLCGSLLMGVTVLLMHVHYSIDVFAAFFITHGIFSLSHKIFDDLNIRFKNRLKSYNFRKIQRKIVDLRERRKREKPSFVSEFSIKD